MRAATLSRKSDEWSTPQWLFDALDAEFNFTLDPCSTDGNNKVPRHFTRMEDGLLQDWSRDTVFVNPPYSKVADWIRKSYGASLDGATVVCLVASRTDTRWWHEFVMKAEVRFIRGRLRFGGAKHSAPFPSAVVVFRPTNFRLTAQAASDAL